MVRRAIVTAAIAAGAVLGCQPGPGSSAPPATASPPPGSATLEITGTWAPCHPMGSCVYRAELVTAEARRTIDLRIAAGDALVPGPGIPAELPAGSYELEFVSTMLGDTIEPNGSVTVLGEEARCTVQFSVGPGEQAAFHAAVAFVPGTCTIELTSEVSMQ